MKRIVGGAVAVALILAYAVGFWPEHRRLKDAQAQLQVMQSRLASAEDRIGLGGILSQLLQLSDAVDARNYGEAATLSSTFFDSVPVEASQNDQPGQKQVLDEY